MENSNQNEYEAANFLVEQMNLIQEEKMELIAENEKLQIEMESLHLDLNFNNENLQKYQEYFNLNDEKNQIIYRLKEKIEELEDCLEQMKEKGYFL